MQPRSHILALAALALACCAHPTGEGISMVVTATIISYLGWRWGFWIAGGVWRTSSS